GGWPDLGLGRVWNAVAGWFRPATASAEPSHQDGGVRGERPKPPPHRVGEVADRRSAHARVFAMSDGTFEAELSARPESFMDSQGHWRDIDTTVRPVGRDGFRFGN